MTKANNDNKRLMNRHEAAAYCGVGVSTFYSWVKAGHIPQPLFGSKRWDKAAIDAALDKASGLNHTASSAPTEDPLEKWLRECG